MSDELEPTVYELAAEIRRVDGNNTLGAAALAEALLPFIIDRLTDTLAERDHWRANHDDAVKRCALLRERHDLPVDRIAAYKELVRLQEEVKAMKKGSGDEAAVDGLPEGSAVDHDKIALIRFVEGVRDTAIALDDSLEDWRASRRLSNPPTSLYPSVLLVEAPRRLKDAANALLEQVGTRAQSGKVGEGAANSTCPTCDKSTGEAILAPLREFRDTVLHERGALEGEWFGADRVNAVLSEFDDAMQAVEAVIATPPEESAT